MGIIVSHSPIQFPMDSIDDTKKIMVKVWPHISRECQKVLASELHYQAMIYRCFREYGKVPAKQIGMNVKIRVMNPRVNEFVIRDSKKHEDYQGGYEPIPDIVLFSREINGNFQRRNRKNTLAQMLMAIEVKASEKEDSRIRPKEIEDDLKKLDAFREEAAIRHSRFIPTMIVLDTAHEEEERMIPQSVDRIFSKAEELGIGLFYLSHIPKNSRVYLWDHYQN